MNIEELLHQKLARFSLRDILGVVLSGLGVIILVISLINKFFTPSIEQSCPSLSFISDSHSVSPANASSSAQLDESNAWYVDVAGAVNKPGLYQVKPGDRLARAIELAGGLTKQAHPTFIKTSLNLAASISDGQKIYIPTRAENIDVVGSNQTLPSTKEMTKGLNTAGDSQKALSLINLNTASLTSLEELPGIGEKRAQAIIDGRPYESVQELTQKGVISGSLLAQIQEFVTVE